MFDVSNNLLLFHPSIHLSIYLLSNLLSTRLNEPNPLSYLYHFIRHAAWRAYGASLERFP